MSDMMDSDIFSDLDEQEEQDGVLVVILHCEAKQSDKNVSLIKRLFSDPYFIVQDFHPSNRENENKSFKEALTFASKGPFVMENNNIQSQSWWTNLPCIIIKDSSVSNISPNEMKERIKTSLEKAKTADLFFLCKWNDECNKFTDVQNHENIKWSKKPTSTQAIMFTPKSRDNINEMLRSNNLKVGDFLNNQITEGNLLATVFVPNIVDFDVNLATSNSDYAKLNECAPVSNTNNKNVDMSIYVWILVVSVLLILISLFILQVSR